MPAEPTPVDRIPDEGAEDRVEEPVLKDAVAGGDKAHLGARKATQGRWKNSIGGMRWYMKTKRDFSALPEG